MPASHWRPRTPAGRHHVLVFVALFLLAQPPLVFLIANRIEPRLFGVPFLFVYLLVVYGGQIAVLVSARRRDL